MHASLWICCRSGTTLGHPSHESRLWNANCARPPPAEDDACPSTKPREPETTAPTTGDGTPRPRLGGLGNKTAKQDAPFVARDLNAPSSDKPEWGTDPRRCAMPDRREAAIAHARRILAVNQGCAWTAPRSRRPSGGRPRARSAWPTARGDAPGAQDLRRARSPAARRCSSPRSLRTSRSSTTPTSRSPTRTGSSRSSRRRLAPG